MKIVLFNDIGSDSFLYVDGRYSLQRVHDEAKKHYDKMVKFKGSFSNEYGIGKSIKSTNANQFRIEV